MKNTMRLLIMLVGFFYLTGFTGEMNVTEPLELNAKKGNKNVQSGDYGVQLVIKNPRRLILEIETENKVTNPQLEIFFPREKQLGPRLGQFQLSPKESGQKYWINGFYDEQYSRTQERYIVERCTEVVPVRYCYVDRYGRQYCEVRYEERTGRREAWYFDEIIDREISLGFAKTEVEADIATLEAEGRDEARRYTRSSPCYIN